MSGSESSTELLSIDQAVQHIVEATTPLPTRRLSIDLALGHRLACELKSDVDSPRFDKSLMDGFAVRSADIAADACLPVVASLFAGGNTLAELPPGHAARIMTGAPVPRGADAIVMVELSQLEMIGDVPHVRFSIDSIPHGKHMMPRGDCMTAGESVFPAGKLITPPDIGLLAESGNAVVEVFSRPSAAIVVTGDELVPAGDYPQGSQIRNSNGPMLMACATSAGIDVRSSSLARDDGESLRREIQGGLDHDLLILSGGVSEGLADLVPGSLIRAGVTKRFHKVAIKPGKPVWFGTYLRPDGGTCYVFALPGNPVSSLVCFEVFVRLAVDRLSGSPSTRISTFSGVLADEHLTRGPRPTWWPCHQTIDDKGEVLIRALPWRGSSDLRCLAAANAIAHFPARATPWPKGSIVQWRTIAGRSRECS